MARQKPLKKLEDTVVYMGVACLQFFLLRVSRESAMRFADVLGRLVKRVAKKPRKIIEDNLQFVYEEKLDSAARGKLVSDIFRFQAENAVDTLLLPRLTKKDIDERVRVENFHLMEEALSKKRGVLFLAAHFNDGGMGLLLLASRGYPVCMIYRPFRNRKLMTLLTKPLLNYPDVQLVPRGVHPTDFYKKQLAENKIITTAVDQHAEEKWVTIPFMGKPAQTACGWVVLAQKSRAPVLVGFCLRDEGARYRFIVEDPGELVFTGDMQRDLYENTLRVNKIIESYVYKFPEQWFWVHKRWKAAQRSG